MDERSLRILEWDKIKQQVAEFASFSLGKQLILALEPSANFDEVERNLEQTTQALALLWKHGVPPFGGAADIAPILRRAQVGGILEGEELIRLAAVLECAANIKRYLSDSDHFAAFREQLSTLPELRSEIFRCFDDEGSIKDNASPQLASIRRKIKNLENRVRDKLDNIIHSSSNQKLLQDSIVTIRSGRFVVPVKQEYRSFFPGIVHDQSASGATVFVEPAAVVEINNELRIAHQEEHREIERILREFSSEVVPHVEELKLTLETLAELDLIFAKGKYSRKIQGTAPKLNQNGYVNIKQGRHPLLTGTVVPIDLWLGDKAFILVITGPNTGGKTVTLKTVGLFAVMTQAGLHIPAEAGSHMAVFDNIFADIGDEQSIEQSLSTFSSHMSNIVKILEQSTSNSLVLLDELGAGTDPTEGAALATALLEHLRLKRVTTIATTHYSELKNFAYANPEVENASVEFDPVTLKPTYRLAIGIPGQSNAFAIARGLGLSDEIVAAARSLLNEERIRIDEIIGEIEADRQESRKAREEAESLRAEYNALKQKYDLLYRDLSERRGELLIQAQEEAAELVKKTREELDLLVGELRRQQNIDLEKIVAAKRQELMEQQKKLKTTRPQKPAAEPVKHLKVGEQVRVRSLNQTGHVVELSDNEAQVQVGIMKVSVSLTDLERANHQPQSKVTHRIRSRGLGKSSAIKPEIDLRGFTIDEALPAVDKYLDDAFLSSLNQVRIIHGKGTGALRDAVQDQLRSHPHVKSFRLADPNQGGSGVTVVELNH
ncbi:MAG TPA: endonuclease MutS2 [Firmicutes bacterium]|nr:endonuclease MutS2 [Bacillota bacterium]